VIRKSLVSVLLGFMIVAANASAAKGTPREVFGLRLGISEQAAHKLLRKIATQQKEEKEEEEGGEQEVWILKRDAKFKYLLTRFDREHRLILITAVAQSQQVRYADVGSLDDATKTTDGINYSYKWKVEPGKQERPVILIARGSSPAFLTSYSLYFTR
jgi:hypothetical protein